MPSRAIAFIHQARNAERKAQHLLHGEPEGAQMEATKGLVALQKAVNYWEGAVPIRHMKDMMELQLTLYQIYAETRTRAALDLQLTKG